MKKAVLVIVAMLMAFCLLTASAFADDGKITLEFWHSMGSKTGELIQEIVDEFNASQDEIYIDCIYQGDYTTGGTKIQAAVASGNGPAIAQIEITRVGMYAAAGALLDLTPYAEADENFDVKSLYPGVMDFSYYDGQLVSLPNGRSVPVMYYNVDALKAAGLEVTSAEMRYVPTSRIPVDDATAEKLDHLLESIDDLDDVTNVYTNAE